MHSFVSILGYGYEALRRLRLASSSLYPRHSLSSYWSFSPDKPSEGNTAGEGSILTVQTRQSRERTCKSLFLLNSYFFLKENI